MHQLQVVLGPFALFAGELGSVGLDLQEFNVEVSDVCACDVATNKQTTKQTMGGNILVSGEC